MLIQSKLHNRLTKNWNKVNLTKLNFIFMKQSNLANNEQATYLILDKLSFNWVRFLIMFSLF